VGIHEILRINKSLESEINSRERALLKLLSRRNKGTILKVNGTRELFFIPSHTISCNATHSPSITSHKIVFVGTLSIFQWHSRCGSWYRYGVEYSSNL